MKKFEVRDCGNYNSELILNGKKIFSTADINIQAFRDYSIRSIGFWENTRYDDFKKTIFVGAGYCCDGMVYILKNYRNDGSWTLYNATHAQVSVDSMLPICCRFQDLMIMGTACGGSGIRLINTEGHRHHDSLTLLEGLNSIMKQVSEEENGRPIFALENKYSMGLDDIFIKALQDSKISKWQGIQIDDLLQRNGVDLEKTLQFAKGFKCVYF